VEQLMLYDNKHIICELLFTMQIITANKMKQQKERMKNWKQKTIRLTLNDIALLNKSSQSYRVSLTVGCGQ